MTYTPAEIVFIVACVFILGAATIVNLWRSDRSKGNLLARLHHHPPSDYSEPEWIGPEDIKTDDIDLYKPHSN